jgi:two-component system, NarL family, nitrate/nitrite response regulator NarL
VFKIELLLRSRLVRETLSAVLLRAEFLVLTEPEPEDCDAIVIIDWDDCRESETVRAHQARGVKVVVLASETDNLELRDHQLAPLSGILTYSLSADAFVRSLRLIGAGERLFPDGWVHRQSLPKPSPATKPQSCGGVRFSRREREVLSHVVKGHSNKAIAQRLGITEATTKVHLKSVLRKINVDNRTQAAIWALANLSELDAAPCGFV